MFARLIALATLALSRASALTLTAPTAVAIGESVTILWQATTTDPPVFVIQMVNTASHSLYNIAWVQTSTGFLSFGMPQVSIGDGYTFEAVDSSNQATVYATSGDFVISAQSTPQVVDSAYATTTPAPFVTMSLTTTSAPSQTSSQSSPSKSSSNTSTVGTIAGAVVGGVVLLVILVVLGIYYKRKASHSSDLASSRRLQRNDDGCEVIDGQATQNFTHKTDRASCPLLPTTAGQASSPINPFPYQTAPVHFAPRIQPRTLSHHLSASSFTVSNGASPLNSTQASRMSSDIDDFARHPGAGSSSMSSSGGRIATAAGATGINPPPQIIMHVDSEDVPVAPDVIELPPQYVERQPFVAEPTSLPNQKPL